MAPMVTQAEIDAAREAYYAADRAVDEASKLRDEALVRLSALRALKQLDDMRKV